MWKIKLLRAIRRRKLLKRAKRTPQNIKHPCESLFEKDIVGKEDLIADHIKKLFPINKTFIESVSKGPEKQSYVLSSFVGEEIFLMETDKNGICRYTQDEKRAMTFSEYEHAEKFVKKLNDFGNPLYFVIKPL